MLGIQETTVSHIAASSLAAVRVFERLGIDYCCGGKRPLADVCREKGYDPSSVRGELESAMSAVSAPGRDWNSAPLQGLIDHIVGTHHEHLRRELGPLGTRLDKVYRVSNEKYGPTLTGLPEVFAGLRSELEMHMRKEEMILFPVIAAYESATLAGSPLPGTPFGSVGNPIRMMRLEKAGVARWFLGNNKGTSYGRNEPKPAYTSLQLGINKSLRVNQIH